MDLIDDIKSAQAAGATDTQLAAARDFQRKAQFYFDFVEAENSTGFHAPDETMRILGESIDFSRRGQKALRDLLPKPAPAIPPTAATGTPPPAQP